MDVLRCAWCGDDFDSRNKNYKYCSERCRKESKKDYMDKFQVDPKNIARKNELRKGKYWNEPEYRKVELRKNALSIYHWTPEKYDDKLKEQGGHCALCEKVAGKKSLHVDHDHTCCPDSKRVTCGKCNRGILCQSCNTRLGYLEQTLRESSVNPQPNTWTARAITYLKSYEKPRFTDLVTAYLALGKYRPGSGIRITNVEAPCLLG